jgi:hypothetical protein
MSGPVQEVDLHIRFLLDGTSGIRQYAMVLVNERLEVIAEDIPTCVNTTDLVFEKDPNIHTKAYLKRELLKETLMVGFRVADDGTRHLVSSSPVLLMALCIERNFPISKSFGEVLYILVLKARGETYERVGTLEVTGDYTDHLANAIGKKEGSGSDAWLTDSQERSIKIV